MSRLAIFRSFFWRNRCLKRSKSGTPQGGIISPILFVGGIHDMSLWIVCALLHSNFADDSSSLISGETNDLLFREARLAAGCMTGFCDANFLQLNASKSVMLQFRHPTAPARRFSPLVSA